MELQPVKHCPPPGYPTRDILGEHPELLRLVPERWRANPLVLGVLTGTLSLLSACRQAESKTNAVSATAKAARVAPLFIHGEGRGSFGCVAVNPPVFLGEFEARAVIRDEAQKAGIAFANDGPRLAKVSVPITNKYGLYDERRTEDADADRKQRRTQNLPLSLDGVDAPRQIAFEYVSKDDFDAWELEVPGYGSSVRSFDLKGAAAQLQPGLSAVNLPLSVGVFYDPLACEPLPSEAAAEEAAQDKLAAEAAAQSSEDNWRQRWEREEAAKRRHAEELLRQQVRDFVAWLKAQGVI